MIKFECDYSKFISEEDFVERVRKAGRFVWLAQSAQMGGWADLPVKYNQEELERIIAAGEKIREDSDYLVCIGIGGSYLGYRAVISALGSEKGRTKILYTGNSFSARECERVLNKVKDKDFSINVISKSGTTTETAIAFRLLRQRLIERYGTEEAARRIYVTTDGETGALHDEAKKNHYQSFVVPNNVGGRFSVLTPVGLLPIAAAGFDVKALLAGAEAERNELIFTGGNAAKYAVMRNLLLEKGFVIEVLANFEPSFRFFNDWVKQLYGESEGKDHKGIFPTGAIYSTDLHSLGQYMQDGQRIMFETFLEVEEMDGDDIVVPVSVNDGDGINYLAGRKLNEINSVVAKATREAHSQGGVPVMRIMIPKADEASLGALIYFYEMTCALSAFILGVNPFNQPGVEAYKTNMFRLLGKPGYN